MARGVGEEHTVYAASSSAGNADVPKPPETGQQDAILAKQRCLLQALPCPLT